MSSELRAEQFTPLQNAVYLLQRTQAKLAAYERTQSEPIAVIGMGCRFPGGGENPNAFWRLCATEWTPSRKFPRTAGTSTNTTIRIPRRPAR